MVGQAAIGTDIAFAAQCLRQGRLVGIPTETVYGLAANALNPDAVAAVFVAKNRPTFDPLIVHCASAQQVWAYVANVPAWAQHLAAKFWPGPLTLLLPKTAAISDLVTAGSALAAFRVPAHPMVQQLLQQLDFPLAAPSANPFGYISPTTAQHVQAQLGGAVAYILDGGPSRIGIESTIVGYENGACTVYRLGGITVEALQSVVGPVTLALQTGDGPAPTPAAPGQLTTHYAPRTPLVLGDLSQLVVQHAGKKIGIIGMQVGAHAVGKQVVEDLAPDGELAHAAQNLFAALRRLDGLGLDVILAQPLPEAGLGRAMNDRLRRAAVSRKDV
jgi:L-threonylcarbamoyladenylate synthase